MRFSLSLPSDREFDVVGFGLNAVDHLVTVPRYPPFNSKTRLVEHRQLAGGQVSSAMVGAQRLGLRTSYIGKIGDDHEGRLLIDSLEMEGVEHSGILIAPGARTQSAVIVIELFSGERTILWHHDEGTKIQPEEIDLARIVRGKVLHLDGYDTAAAIAAARAAHNRSMAVTMDLDTAYDGIEALLPLVDFLIMSQGLADTLSGVMDERQALQQIHERFGCYFVGMTQGARGALAYVEGEFVATPAFRPPVCRDTTGAGDAFRAGFIYGLITGQSIEETMRTANAVAALKCRELGARAALPTVDELRAFIG